MRVTVAVIGAGPAGVAAAIECLRLGCGPVLVLEKTEADRRKSCGGGLSPAALGQLERLGLWDEISAKAQMVDSLLVQGPAGARFQLGGPVEAAVMDRLEFDRLLRRALVRHGAELKRGITVESLEQAGCGWHLGYSDGGTLQARFVVLACGASSVLRGKFKRRRGKRLFGASALFEGVEFVGRRVEMYFLPELNPHYAWLFPLPDGRANLGVCFMPNRGKKVLPRRIYRMLSICLGDRLAGARQLVPFSYHPIDSGGFTTPPAGVYPVGDAAGLSDHATGEGIFQALLSGRVAARFIILCSRARLPAGAAALAYRLVLDGCLAPRRVAAAAFSNLFAPRLDSILGFTGKLGLGKTVARYMAGM